jgi:hypothetical protein
MVCDRQYCAAVNASIWRSQCCYFFKSQPGNNAHGCVQGRYLFEVQLFKYDDLDDFDFPLTAWPKVVAQPNDKNYNLSVVGAVFPTLSGSVRKLESGVCTFNDIMIDVASIPLWSYVLRVSARGFSIFSKSFKVTPGVFAKIHTNASYENWTAGISYPVHVYLTDNFGNFVASPAYQIQASVASTVATRTLYGTTLLSGTAGVVRFDISVQQSDVTCTSSSCSRPDFQLFFASLCPSGATEALQSESQ